MKKGSSFSLVFIFALFLSLTLQTGLGAFDTYAEKTKAYQMAYEIDDLNGRRTLIRNILI